MRWILLLLILFLGSLDAHQVTEQGEEKGAIETRKKEETLKPYKVPPFTEALTEHLHNKIVHFPIAFFIAAVMFLILGLKWQNLDSAGKILLILAAISALLAYFTGRAQKGFYHGKPKEGIVEIHEKLGMATLISIWVMTFISFVRTLRKVAVVIGLAVVGLILYTAFYGGLIAHG